MPPRLASPSDLRGACCPCPSQMKVALAQINTTVGDFAGNEAKIRAAYDRACAAGADLAIFPELATCGYPPRDLLLKRQFVDENLALLERLAKITSKTGLLTGFVGKNERQPGRETTNAVANRLSKQGVNIVKLFPAPNTSKAGQNFV